MKGRVALRNWIAALAAAGVLFAALPTEVVAQSRQVSPIYAPGAKGTKPAKPKKATTPRSAKQKAAQKKATKAAAAKMKRSGPTLKQKAAQKKASKAAAAKAKATPNKRRA